MERIDAGRIDATKQITPKELVEAGLVTRVKDGIKIIGHGSDDVRTPIDIVVSRASAGAIQSIEKAGGRITTRYFTKQSTMALLKGQAVCTTTPLPTGPRVCRCRAGRRKEWTVPIQTARPPRAEKDMEYYRDPAHRGYLRHMLRPGESPSLFFKVPTPLKFRVQKKEDAEKQEGEAEEEGTPRMPRCSR